jgi:hypothetical protein
MDLFMMLFQHLGAALKVAFSPYPFQDEGGASHIGLLAQAP